LSVFQHLIEDDSGNTTTFAVIRKKKKFEKPKGKKTSIAFNFDKDSPGSLFSILQVFADRKINMTKIESRPSSKERGEYVFYIDFDGNINLSKVKTALMDIKKKVAKLKVLGCY